MAKGKQMCLDMQTEAVFFPKGRIPDFTLVHVEGETRQLLREFKAITGTEMMDQIKAAPMVFKALGLSKSKIEEILNAESDQEKLEIIFNPSI